MCLNSKKIEFDDVIDIMREKLNNGGTITFTPKGTSMEPMLRDGKDIVVLAKPKGRLNMLDVALYRRDDGAYIMHRVIDVDDKGCYVFCGDNQFAKEKGIREDQIIGIMTCFIRKGTTYYADSILYKLYSNYIYRTRLSRRGYKAGKRKVVKLFGLDKKKSNDDVNGDGNGDVASKSGR